MGIHTDDRLVMILIASFVGLGLQFESPYYLDRFWFLISFFHAYVDVRNYTAGGEELERGDPVDSDQAPVGG